MSKFRLDLSYKNCCILKHSLKMRIDNDKPDYELLSKLNDNEITANGKKFMKEHEEHIRCFEALNEEVERTGYMYGRNIFKK